MCQLSPALGSESLNWKNSLNRRELVRVGLAFQGTLEMLSYHHKQHCAISNPVQINLIFFYHLCAISKWGEGISSGMS